MRFGLIWQTWSSRDLSLGLLETRFYKSWSRSWTSESWSWNLRVLVSVLEPSSLGLGLGSGLETVEQMKLRSVVMEYLTTPRTPNSDPWVEVARSDTYKMLHPLLEKSGVRLPPLLLWNGYSATAVCWCGQTRLGWGTTGCHSWFTCDATISCKFSWCCTVVISL